MMIKKILTTGALAASTAFLVPHASAQTFSPGGPFTLTSIGTMVFSKGITLNCSLTGSGGIAGGAASVSSITLANGLCAGVLFTGTSYVVSSASLTSITLNGVVISGFLGGTCAGALTGDYNQSTGVITFRAVTLPSISGGNPCRIAGRVQLSPAVTFTIP
jgi:hypothetical protein